MIRSDKTSTSPRCTIAYYAAKLAIIFCSQRVCSQRVCPRVMRRNNLGKRFLNLVKRE